MQSKLNLFRIRDHMDKDDLEELWREYQTKAKQVYKGVTGDE